MIQAGCRTISETVSDLDACPWFLEGGGQPGEAVAGGGGTPTRTRRISMSLWRVPDQPEFGANRPRKRFPHRVDPSDNHTARLELQGIPAGGECTALRQTPAGRGLPARARGRRPSPTADSRGGVGASPAAGHRAGVQLLKFHTASPKVSFLAYPDFDRNPQVTGQVGPWMVEVRKSCESPLKSPEIQGIVVIQHRKTFQRNYPDRLLDAGLIERTIPDKPNSRLQKHRLTDKAPSPDHSTKQ